MKKRNGDTKIVRAVVDKIDDGLADLIFAGTDRMTTVPLSFIGAAAEGDVVEITFKVLEKESRAARGEIADIINELKEL